MSSQGSDIHFFKRIEEETLRNGELRIPRSFVTKFWEGMSNPVMILLTNGDKWEMNWKNVGADVWLIGKWKEFAMFYCLDQDHLLVFRYVGKSEFQVIMFDQNGLEFEYPLMEETSACEENGNFLSQHKRAQSPLPCSHSTKKLKSKHSQSSRTKVQTENFDNAKPKKRGRRRSMYANTNRRCSKSNAIQSEKLLEVTESNTALERANAFSSENPFFIRQMYPSYIKKHFMAMPSGFITEDQQKEVDSISLWISGRNWDVKFYPNRCSAQIMLCSGWMEFVKDNSLKIGDVCVFEQIKKPGVSFRVIIYHHGEESNPSMVSDSELGGCVKKMLENHFSFSIKPTEFYCKSIPKSFIRNHGIYDINEATLRMENRRWHVKIDSNGRFTCGWCVFTRECNLNVRDICHFELIDKKDLVFDVTITKVSNV